MDKVNFFAKNILIALVMLFGVEVFGAGAVHRISIDEIVGFVEAAQYETTNGTQNKETLKKLNAIFSAYKTEASKGDAYSKYVLGMFCMLGYDGTTLTVNPTNGFAWLIESANGGYASAMYALGTFYSAEGFYNPKEAFKWYLCAAESGDVMAQTRVSDCYEHGIGTASNPTAAFMWCERAANNNDPEAQYKLATMYERGFGVRRDTRKCIYWFNAAARLGNKEAAKRIDEFNSVKEKLVAIFRKSSQIPRMLAEADKKRREGHALQMAKSSHNGFASRGGYGLSAYTDNSAANMRGSALCSEADAIESETENIKAEEKKYVDVVLDMFEVLKLTSYNYKHTLYVVPLSYQDGVLIAVNSKTRKIVKFNAAQSLSAESLDLLSEME